MIRTYLFYSLLVGLLFISACNAPDDAITNTPTVLQQNTVEQYLQTHKAKGDKPNRLIEQSSPYLLQHAYNPVQWYAWGAEAFEQARKQNKPIFLSIGYSTCHWCHVMAHESFEDDEIAELLNEHFISIKVDREERPDIDNVYMSATYLINGYGGWPMTVFLNHRLQPFHAGTYYPRTSRDGHIGLKELLMWVNELWRDENERVNQVAETVTEKLKAEADDSDSSETLKENIALFAMLQIVNSYDEEFGGFGAAPKFPNFGIFAFLLAQAESDEAHNAQALRMIRDTLKAMSKGGIYDQLAGGFHRYAVDEQWQVPHFEKMLYTQALMALAFTRLYEIEAEPYYRDIATGTLDFVLHEMAHEDGVFYSALDADSERPDEKGETGEGAYYLWRAQDMEAALSHEEWKLMQQYYSIADNGNIASDPQGEFSGLNILYIDVDNDMVLTDAQRVLLQSARQKLHAIRIKRPRPHLDDKIITAWNGMMIKALVEAGRVFNLPAYQQAATRAADIIHAHLRDQASGSLHRRMRNNVAGIDAGLDDYVWYANALLALHRQTQNNTWLQRAMDLTDRQIGQFYDEDKGGFFESSTDEYVLFRSKSAYDGALPAANAVAIANLQQLARLTSEQRWQSLASASTQAFASSINASPSSASWLLSQL